MYVNKIRNVNYALEAGLALLLDQGSPTGSRVGSVLRAPAPVCTVYEAPLQRVLFSPIRDANPFFHLMEALWMMTGRNDIEFLKTYNPRMAAFSDDGEHQWGAYGWRWREFFDFDQLPYIIDLFKTSRTTRRAVLTMWSPGGDLQPGEGCPSGPHGVDVPCNTHVYFANVGDSLDLTVCCRSNDAVWGAHGANAVHFSILQEFMAAAIGMPVGRLYQFSNDYHVYDERDDVVKLMNRPLSELTDDRYKRAGNMLVRPLTAGMGWERWLKEVESFVEDPILYRPAGNDFLGAVAKPLAVAHGFYRTGDLHMALAALGDEEVDWLVNAREWIQRRIVGREVKNAAR